MTNPALPRAPSAAGPVGPDPCLGRVPRSTLAHHNPGMRKAWLTAYEPELQAELLRTGHHNLLAAAAGGLVFMPLVALAAWHTASRNGLLLWLTSSLAANLLAWTVWGRWRTRVAQIALHGLDAHRDATTVHRWMWAHGSVMSAMGAATGAFGALYVPANGMHNLFVAAAFQGALAYSAAGNATHDLPAFLSSLLVAAVLMCGFIPAGFGPNAWQMIGLCGLYTGTLTWVGLQAHRSTVRTIRLQIANRRLAAEHAQAATQAQRANRSKSEFLAAASHDLRQPVHALVLLIAALRQLRRQPAAPAHDGENQAGQDRLIDSIDQAGQAIGHLFNDLMELSRLESGHQPVLPQPVHVPDLLAQARRRHLAEADAKGLSVRLRVGRTAQDAWIDSDRVMLERCVANLMSNALRYTHRGKVLLTLRRHRGGNLLLSVRDTGVGISPADQQRIFEPYVQLGNAERDRSKGLGLGLAIVKQCAERLGYPLSVQSTAGRGSCFTLVLPPARCQPEMTSPLAVPAPSTTVHADTCRLDGRRLLLIDDDPMVRDAMRSLLAAWRIELKTVEHGEDPALDALLQDDWTPDLVICDHRLPGHEQGLALLGRLQEHWPDCAALLQTGEPRERVQQEAESAGFPVLYKPVPPELLRSTLLALLPALD